MSNIFKIVTLHKTRYQDYYPVPTNLCELLEWVQSILNRIPEEHRDQGCVIFKCNGDELTLDEIYYRRPKNEEDYQEERRLQEEQKANQLEQRRKMYEELKKEFE